MHTRETYCHFRKHSTMPSTERLPTILADSNNLKAVAISATQHATSKQSSRESDLQVPVFLRQNL